MEQFFVDNRNYVRYNKAHRTNVLCAFSIVNIVGRKREGYTMGISSQKKEWLLSR